MANAAPHRIDVHHHISPPSYLADLDDQRVFYTGETKNWTPQQSIELMDQGSVQTSITSITTPGLWFGDPVRAKKLARLCNDYAAKLNSEYPKRFGMFVNLPMPDIEASLKEIEYGLDQLKADGIVFFTSYGNHWLGDPAFDPVFEELNRRKALIYVHPKSADCCVDLIPGVTDSLIEYGTDTTRCIAQMILSGRSARFPDLKIIWSHGGGTMPMLAVRFGRAAQAAMAKKLIPNGFLPEARRFYYDTAAIDGAPPLAALRRVVPVSQILFGTDVPWGKPLEIATHVIESGVFNEEELRAIDRENALRLVPQYR